MDPATILAIVQIFAVLEPVAIQGINSAITMFQSSNLPEDQKMKMLTDLAAALKPMEIKA
jgi:ABC-type Na+ efflux pump permease subunit